MTNVQSLAGLIRLRQRPDRFRQQITFSIPEVPTDSAQAADQRIRGYQRECGCAAGAAFLFAAMSLSATFFGVRYGVVSWEFVIRLPLVLLISFVAGGAGKMAALIRARRRLDRELDLLIRSFA